MLSEMFSSSQLAQAAATTTTGILDSQIITWNHRWQQRMQTADHETDEKQPQINAADVDFVNNLHQYNNNYSQQWHNFVADETNSHFRGFHSEESGVHQYNWIPGSSTSNCEEDDHHQNYDHNNQVSNYHGQGLSLSLSNSSAMRPLGTGLIKFEDVRMGNHDQGQFVVGFGASLEKVNVMRNSKYGKAAKELLEEICSTTSLGLTKNQSTVNPNSGKTVDPSTDRTAVGSCCTTSSLSKGNFSTLSAADKSEYQRRKVKLISMLDEVDGRYRSYREKMRGMVNSFDSVMGYGGAKTYTTMAQKAMSRHFRSVRNSVVEQLKATCEMLGEKEVGGSYGITKGETPRLKALDQSVRQQKAIQQMGMGMLGDLEAWRPQRGLPERSLNILRAWLFDHFLNPYPSDADKHLLSRQTGLSKNQVSNWFINARVRLWKPMVEEMYQRDAKEEEPETTATDTEQKLNSADQDQTAASPLTHSSLEGPSTFSAQRAPQHVINAPSSQADTFIINSNGNKFFDSSAQSYPWLSAEASVVNPSEFVFGRINGDVSLTLGLRHAGNAQEGQVPTREFRTC
ncbi:BEL1-like homeodomain protein 4 [Impatiens glandulifera]|uniref:BEL1-like homeodomain protein 4 n=1 Tax=Impatiens glandulifera TaxID=253017 RepID=UPI001FB18CC5|nr:BEL1-like homeodomain protein 4 [Impatiens glandulifera]XP_047326950.1 BEL1-like homeodomain protein 4 [Impatiens glandulifera]